MKYKVLLNGRNSTMVTDFIQYTDVYFKCLSTSECMKDVINHFELFQPDAYVCFVDSYYCDVLAQIPNIKENPAFNSASIVVVGNAETCDEIEAHFLHKPDLIVKRPISADNLALSIGRFLDNAKENASPAASEKSDGEVTTVSSGKKHILVVDDDRSVLKLLKAALSDTYEVTTMANGLLIEKFLTSRNVDLIILDYEMPVETGADIFRRLKKNPKVSNIPVCFLTGVTERSKIIEIMMLKPHGYLLKPIDIDMLRATISNLTD